MRDRTEGRENNRGMSTIQPENVKKHQILFHEGDETHHFYILLTGKLAVFRQKKYVRSISGRGVFVGEMGSLLGFKRSATVITLETSSLLVIPNSVEQIFVNNREIGIKLLSNLRRRLSETYDRAEKLWERIFKEIMDIVIYEATTRSVIRNNLGVDKIEAEKSTMSKAVQRDMLSPTFEFSNIRDMLGKFGIEEAYDKQIKEKYPRFKYVDLKQMKDLWKKPIPQEAVELLRHCLDLARGLNDLTEFITSYEHADEATGMEEVDMLESCIPLARRTEIFRGLARDVLTDREGIERMKRVNRDIDVDLEEADRHERRTGRIFFLTDVAKRFGVREEYLDKLRRDYWDMCLDKEAPRPAVSIQ